MDENKSNNEENKVKKKKKRRKKRRWPLILVFLIGFSIFLYPQVSRIYYRIEANNQISKFDQGRQELDSEEINRRIELAQGYNMSLDNIVSDDPYDEEIQKEGVAAYARMLEIHEQIGHVQIPKLDVNIPIYAGTAPSILEKGAGHLEGTSLPIGGNNTHSVITAHSGLPTAKLFSTLNQLEIGDVFYVQNLKETLAYQVNQIKTIDPSDFSDLLVEKGHDYTTLLTCTPIMINTHRLIVRGHRIAFDPGERDLLVSQAKELAIYRYIFISIGVFLIVLILLGLYYYRKKRRIDRAYERRLYKDQEVKDD